MRNFVNYVCFFSIFSPNWCDAGTWHGQGRQIHLYYTINYMVADGVAKRGVSLQSLRHNGRDGVLKHQPHDYLLNRLIRRRSKTTSKLRVTGLCAGNSPVAGEFPAQRPRNAENVSIWWRHHIVLINYRIDLVFSQHSNLSIKWFTFQKGRVFF